MNFVSTPWKVIITLGNSVGDHIWVIQIHMGEENKEKEEEEKETDEKDDGFEGEKKFKK